MLDGWISDDLVTDNQVTDIINAYLGMGNIFGPSDPELKAAEENPIKRNQIIEVSQLELVVNIIGQQLN